MFKAKSGKKLNAFLCSDILVLLDESMKNLYRMVGLFPECIRDCDSDTLFVAYTPRACASKGIWIKRCVVLPCIKP